MPFKKNLLIFTILMLTMTLQTLSMETNYPQLQLQEPKKNNVMHVDCSIMISAQADQTTAYAPTTVHNAILKKNKIESTIKDPLMLFFIKKKSAQNKFLLSLPAKTFINLTDKSVIYIHHDDAYSLYKSHPIFKKKSLLIKATCTKNPNLKGNSFAEQFNNTMNDFYTNPGVPWIDEGYEQELEDTKIIKSTSKRCGILTWNQHGPYLHPITITTFEHGPKGCSNEKAFIQSIIDDKIPTNNLFKSLMHRQITGSFFSKQST